MPDSPRTWPIAAAAWRRRCSFRSAALAQDLTPEEGWKPLRIDVNGPIHKQSVNWILNSLEDHRRRRDFNLLVLMPRYGRWRLE